MGETCRCSFYCWGSLGGWSHWVEDLPCFLYRKLDLKSSAPTTENRQHVYEPLGVMTNIGQWSDLYEDIELVPSLPSSRPVCCRTVQSLHCCSSPHCCWWWWCCQAGGSWWRLPACDWLLPDLQCWGAVHWGSTSAVCPIAETPGAAPKI